MDLFSIGVSVLPPPSVFPLQFITKYPENIVELVLNHHKPDVTSANAIVASSPMTKRRFSSASRMIRVDPRAGQRQHAFNYVYNRSPIVSMNFHLFILFYFTSFLSDESSFVRDDSGNRSGRNEKRHRDGSIGEK